MADTNNMDAQPEWTAIKPLLDKAATLEELRLIKAAYLIGRCERKLEGDETDLGVRPIPFRIMADMESRRLQHDLQSLEIPDDARFAVLDVIRPLCENDPISRFGRTGTFGL